MIAAYILIQTKAGKAAVVAALRGLPASLRRFRDRLVTEAGRDRAATGRVA